MQNLIGNLNNKLAAASSIYRLAKANGQISLIDILGSLVQDNIDALDIERYIDELIYDEFDY